MWFGFNWIFIGAGQTWLLLNPLFFPIYWLEVLFVYLVDLTITTTPTIVIELVIWAIVSNITFWTSMIIIWANEDKTAVS